MLHFVRLFQCNSLNGNDKQIQFSRIIQFLKQSEQSVNEMIEIAVILFSFFTFKFFLEKSSISAVMLQSMYIYIFLKTVNILTVTFQWFRILRIVPQGTFDHILGLDHLEGPKALDPKHCKQLTLWLHDFCLVVLTDWIWDTPV